MYGARGGFIFILKVHPRDQIPKPLVSVEEIMNQSENSLYTYVHVLEKHGGG